MGLVDAILNTSKEFLNSIDKNAIVGDKIKMMATCETISKAIKAVSANLLHGDPIDNSVTNVKTLIITLPSIFGATIGDDKINSMVNELTNYFESTSLLNELNLQESEKKKSFFILKIDKSAGYFASSADIIEFKK